MKKQFTITAATLFVAGVLGACSAPVETPAAAPAVVTETDYETVVEHEPEAPEATDDPVEATGGSISNGDHLVGTNLQPGVYRAEVQSSMFPLCSVSQHSADGQILDIRNAGYGSVIFTVADVPDTVVSFSGCTNIGLAADNVRSNTTDVTNGYWLVGDEIAPGSFTCSVETETSFPFASVVQYAANGSILDIRNASEGNVIFTVADSAGSVVYFSGCGTITRN